MWLWLRDQSGDQPLQLWLAKPLKPWLAKPLQPWPVKVFHSLTCGSLLRPRPEWCPAGNSIVAAIYQRFPFRNPGPALSPSEHAINLREIQPPVNHFSEMSASEERVKNSDPLFCIGTITGILIIGGTRHQQGLFCDLMSWTSAPGYRRVCGNEGLFFSTPLLK